MIVHLRDRCVQDCTFCSIVFLIERQANVRVDWLVHVCGLCSIRLLGVEFVGKMLCDREERGGSDRRLCQDDHNISCIILYKPNLDS
jgi:hypothetical protein